MDKPLIEITLHILEKTSFLQITDSKDERATDTLHPRTPAVATPW